MESRSELSKEETNVSSVVAMVEENCLDNGKIPMIQSTSMDSSCKEIENISHSNDSLFGEVESNPIERDRDTMVHDSRNYGSNSPTYPVHTCPKGNDNMPPNRQVINIGDKAESSSIVNTCLKGNGNVPPKRQVVELGDKDRSSSIDNELECYSVNTCPKDDNINQYLTGTSDPNGDVGLNGLAIKLGGEAKSDNVPLSIGNELECEATSDLKNCNKTTSSETELVLDSSLKNTQPSLNLFSDFDNSSSNESSKIPSLILKRWEDSPSENLWYNLKPCSIVLQRCDINENSMYAKSLSCNYSAKEDTISVISDSEDESVIYSEAKLNLGKLRSRKSHSESSQCSGKGRSSFPSKCLQATIKGTSKMRKNNSKILAKMSDLAKDSDSDNDGPNNNKLLNTCKKTIQVSAQVHKPPESEDDFLSLSDAIIFNTTCKTSSGNNKNKKGIAVEIQSNASTPLDREKNGKRKRNSSSISSMSFSELLSDSEYVGSKRHIIRPSTCLQPSIQIHKELNQETVDNISDLDASDHLNTCFESSEISEKLLTANVNVEIYPTHNNLSPWTNSPDIDISRLTFKPCHVVLNRCDDQIEIYSSEVTDVNSGNQPISIGSSDSNFGFSAKRKRNRCNLNRTDSDSFLSELSDTDEVTPPRKKISPKLKKKKGGAKKKLSGLQRSAKLPARQKILNKSSIMEEILELKNTMKRAEKKIDMLIELHLKILDSD